ncbi:unnamed protein product [Coregonus sp. 'balchen']|nr:unnamed protein product [Coregonus sp. 'balchen']
MDRLIRDICLPVDFPGDSVCGRGASERERERASPLLWKNLPRRRLASHPAESSSEADIDSDSGYCSPKHNQQAPGATQRTADAATAPTPQTQAVSWVNVASQATQRSWSDNRTTPFQRTGKTTDQRNYLQQDFHAGYSGGRVCPNPTPADTNCGLQQRRLQPGVGPGTALAPEPLYFEDEEEFPELVSGGGAQRNNKPDHNPSQTQNQHQTKLTKNLLDNLPENSPINIVQTPIPITTSVPKRAKSQRKKALAAALATAQEYSEISMEQRKLQEALTKAAGKKMGTAAPFHGSGAGPGAGSGVASVLKAQQPHSAPHNMLDSSAPRLKRGKEREIPKVKRPTALKKIILKEREGKRGKVCVDQTAAGQDEQGEEELHFTDDLTREPASQEENGLSVPSDDASLSPASQNSPYSITPVSQGSPASSGIGSPMASNAITKIHSRRFREYCNQVLNKEIDESVTMLLQELVRFQERVYQKDPSKAKTKRRLVMGLREVTKHMKLHKIKWGLDEALYNVIAMAREQEIPFVFALGRKALGRCVNKLVPVSVVGIFNFSGAEGLFNRLVSLTEDARKSYKDMVSALEQEQAEEALKNVKKVTHHMGHSRNPSAASAISFCSVISEPISEVNEKEYETNWRSMVESSDGLEPVEAKPRRTAASSGLQRDNQPPSTTTNRSPYSTTLQLRAAVHAPASGPGEREEGRADDRLELASQQSTETGSLDGSCRDLLNSSITSTTSTLVPGMLEEAEEEEEEEEEYTPEPISVEVPASHPPSVIPGFFIVKEKSLAVQSKQKIAEPLQS